MKRTFLTIITGLFLIFSGSTAMANEAGGSATLSVVTRIDANEISSLNMEKKKLAIRVVLDRYQSPMVQDVDSFIDSCKKYNLDCYLLPSIAGLESTFGRFIWPNSYNAFGWARGYMMFDNWGEGIDTVGKGLRKGYLNRGALGIYEIGPIYSESPTWAVRVEWFMNEFKKEEAKLSLQSVEFPVKL